MIPFTEFPKLARLSRDMVVTEKIDGTNAQVYISNTADFLTEEERSRYTRHIALVNGCFVYAGSRNRWITLAGRGLALADWRCEQVPCCHVVPVLLRHTFDTSRVDMLLEHLQVVGSYAAPSFMKPEGVVVFHAKSGQMFKKTLDKNDGHKGE